MICQVYFTRLLCVSGLWRLCPFTFVACASMTNTQRIVYLLRVGAHMENGVNIKNWTISLTKVFGKQH